MQPYIDKNDDQPDDAVPAAVPMLQDDDHTTTTEMRYRALCWLLAIAAALCGYGIVASLAALLYTPDVPALERAAADVLMQPQFANPEPMEALLFRLAVAVVPAGLYLAYGAIVKMQRIRTWAAGRLCPVVMWVALAAVAGLLAAGFAAPNIYPLYNWHEGSGITEVTNFGYYFTGLFLGRWWWLYLLVVAPGLYYVLVPGYGRFGLHKRPGLARGVRIAGYALGGATLLALLTMNVFDYPYAYNNKYNLNAVYYSMTQVYAGAPLLVKGFTNTYGLYPHFLNLLFQVTGLSVARFSGIMSVMLVGCFVLNYLVLYRLVKDELLRFLGFFTVLFVSYFVHKLSTNFDCVFSLFPIRYIIPSALAWLTWQYLNAPSAGRYWTTGSLMAAAVLWNPEMGIVCYLAWFAVNMYRDVYADTGRVAWRTLARHGVAMLALLPAALLLWKLLIYVTYGAWPDMSLLWSTMLVFGKVGFNLLPMQPLHPWLLPAIIILCGVAYSIFALSRRAVTVRSTMVLLLSLVALGYLFYFQGRSHSDVLSLSSGFSLLLLTVLADDLLPIARQHRMASLRALMAMALVVLGFSVIELPYNAPLIWALVSQARDKEQQAEGQRELEGNKKFFMEQTLVRDKVWVLCPVALQSLYFDGSRRLSAFNPGLIDLFYKKDEQRLYSTLLDSAYHVFMEPHNFNEPHYQPIAARVAAAYQLYNNTGTLVQFRKRQVKAPQAAYFAQDAATLLYRKYTDDSAGMGLRARDALRQDELNLPPVFSVQCLFYACPQPYPSAALVSNRVNDRGFAIYNEFNTEDYVFVINSSGIRLVTPMNQWVYFAVNVYPDRFDVYRNGVFKASKPISKLLQNSGDAFRIGNLSGMAYYAGAIAEVAVSRGSLDSNAIRDTWQRMPH